MTPLCSTLYTGIALQLVQRLEGCGYFNGRVEFQTPEALCALTATMIVYRTEGRITDIVTVWWQFSMQQPGGEEATDFSWSELMKYVMELV